MAGCALAACAAVPAGVHAQALEPPPSRFEIAGFAGYRAGGDFELEDTGEELDLDEHGSFLISLNLRRDEVSQYELMYARQETRLQSDTTLGDFAVDVEYLHIGGTLVVNELHLLRPYIIGSLGATRFSPSPADADDDTRFSISLGAGLRVPVSQRFSLRLEARGYLTFVESDSAIFCASGSFGGVCALRSSGSTFLQFDVLAGVAIAF